MSKLKEEELLGWLDKCWSLYKTSQDEWELSQQAYQQIREIIKKPEVTEEWIEEKAKEFLKMAYAITRTKPDIAEHRINLKFVKQSFIRSFVEEITKKEEEDG